MFLKKNIIQHQQNIEKLIIDYKLLKKAMNFLYKKRIIKVGKKVIIGLAIDRTYMELTNPDPTQDAYETHTNQVEGREEYSTDYVGDIYNWIKKLFK